MNTPASVTQPANENEHTLMRDCNFVSSFWSRLWIGLQLTMLRERGEGDLVESTFKRLRMHQRSHFLPGLEKLGIDRNQPAAIVAAQYHYLSNILGGMEMEYIEESDRKVWIRYHAPAYTWPGNALFAVPSSVQRAMFKAWHPFNGESLGNPRLGFVVTKLYQDGGPYDEGYFIEYDHVPAPEERIRFEPVLTSPDFDPRRAPVLDPKKWPLKRIAMAKRKWSREMFEDVIETTLEMYGVDRTADYLAHTARLFALQYFDELRRYVDVGGSKAAEFAEIFKRFGDISGEEVSVQSEKAGRTRLTRSGSLFKRKGAGIPEKIDQALFEFIKTSAMLHSPRVSVRLESVSYEGSSRAEQWIIQDETDRLF